MAKPDNESPSKAKTSKQTETSNQTETPDQRGAPEQIRASPHSKEAVAQSPPSTTDSQAQNEAENPDESRESATEPSSKMTDFDHKASDKAEISEPSRESVTEPSSTAANTNDQVWNGAEVPEQSRGSAAHQPLDMARSSTSAITAPTNGTIRATEPMARATLQIRIKIHNLFPVHSLHHPCRHGADYQLRLSTHTIGHHLCSRLEEREHIPSHQMRLVYKGEEMDKTLIMLGSYGVGHGSRITVILRNFQHTVQERLRAPTIVLPLGLLPATCRFAVMLPSGRQIFVQTRPDTTLLEFAFAVSMIEGLRTTYQRLSHNGLVIWDGPRYAVDDSYQTRTIAQSLIPPEAILDLKVVYKDPEFDATGYPRDYEWDTGRVHVRMPLPRPRHSNPQHRVPMRTPP